MSKGPNINICHELKSVNLSLGETLTVWMEGIQVELRVLPSGLNQIFHDDEEMSVQKFIMWTTIEQEIKWAAEEANALKERSG